MPCGDPQPGGQGQFPPSGQFAFHYPIGTFPTPVDRERELNEQYNVVSTGFVDDGNLAELEFHDFFDLEPHDFQRLFDPENRPDSQTNSYADLSTDFSNIFTDQASQSAEIDRAQSVVKESRD